MYMYLKIAYMNMLITYFKVKALFHLFLFNID